MVIKIERRRVRALYAKILSLAHVGHEVVVTERGEPIAKFVAANHRARPSKGIKRRPIRAL